MRVFVDGGKPRSEYMGCPYWVEWWWADHLRWDTLHWPPHTKVTYGIIFLCGPIQKKKKETLFSLFHPPPFLLLCFPIFFTSSSPLPFSVTAATANKRPHCSYLSHLCSLLSSPPRSTTFSSLSHLCVSDLWRWWWTEWSFVRLRLVFGEEERWWTEGKEKEREGIGGEEDNGMQAGGRWWWWWGGGGWRLREGTRYERRERPVEIEKRKKEDEREWCWCEIIKMF